MTYFTKLFIIVLNLFLMWQTILFAAPDESACDLDAFNQSCFTGCPYGYSHDKDGCPTCECLATNEDPEASLKCDTSLSCSVTCDDYVIDEYGCATCECDELDKTTLAAMNKEICDIPLFESSCDVGCPSGYQHDDDGCPICKCIVKEDDKCPIIEECPKKCEDYKIIDDCVSCECDDVKNATNLAKQKEATCDIEGFYKNCETGCPLGYKHDDDGCPVCECYKYDNGLANGCSGDVTCDAVCEDYMIGEDGCVTCECGDPL